MHGGKGETIQDDEIGRCIFLNVLRGKRDLLIVSLVIMSRLFATAERMKGGGCP